jgi:hypothetical protein
MQGMLLSRISHRALLLLCCAAATLAMPSAGVDGDETGEVRTLDTLPVIRADFPIPSEEGGLLFYLQRSMNPNTIVYVANLTPDGEFDAKEPVKAYWRRFNDDGAIRELDTDEKIFAFGVKSKPAKSGQNTYFVNIVSYPRRKARVTFDENGHPVALAEMGGREARLIYAYMQLGEGWLMPTIRYVDVFGQDVKTGEYLHERIVNGDDSGR